MDGLNLLSVTFAISPWGHGFPTCIYISLYEDHWEIIETQLAF